MKRILWLIAAAALALAPSATMAKAGYIPIGDAMKCVNSQNR